MVSSGRPMGVAADRLDARPGQRFGRHGREPVGARGEEARATVAAEQPELRRGDARRRDRRAPTVIAGGSEASHGPEPGRVVEDAASDVGDVVEAIPGPRQSLAEVLEIRPAMDFATGPGTALDPDLLGPDRAVPELDRLLLGPVLVTEPEIDDARAEEGSPGRSKATDQPAQEIGLEEEPVVDDEDVRGRSAIEERLRSPAVARRRPRLDEPDGVTPRPHDPDETGQLRLPGTVDRRPGRRHQERWVALVGQRRERGAEARRRPGGRDEHVDEREVHGRRIWARRRNGRSLVTVPSVACD